MNIPIPYLLHLADNNLILGQRLGEWCGHGPILEQDIAMTNLALDLIGQARLLYQYAAELAGDRSEDDLAFLRKEHEYLNILLVEQPNGNFADTVVRQFFYDTFDYLNHTALQHCADERLVALAKRSVKEIAYHRRWSSEWVIRMGDGTQESHDKIQAAVDALWSFTGELFQPADYEQEAQALISAPDVSVFREEWLQQVHDIFNSAAITMPPSDTWMQSGGKNGRHTEYMGYLLSDLQYMQRTYPSMQW